MIIRDLFFESGSTEATKINDFFCRIFYLQQWRPSWLGAGSSDIILKGDHPSTINLAKFSPNWPSGFRGEY
jgi:hypothetical protein